MPRGPMAPLAALSVTLTACAAPAPITVDLSEAGDAVVAVALLDADAAPVRVLPLFELEDGALSAGERPQVALRDQEVSYAFVRIPRSFMEDRFPGAWTLRASFSVGVGAPPDAPRVEAGPERLRWRWTMALPPEVEVTGDTEGRARAGLTFAFEQEAEPCRDPARQPLRPYADRLTPLDAHNGGELRSLVVLDETRVVVGGRGVFLLERNQPYAGLGLAPEVLMHPNAEVFDIAVDPRTRGQSALEMYAVLYTAEGGPPRSALVQVRLDETGFTLVRTATVVPGELRSVDVSARGEVAASSDEGLLLRTGPDGQGLVRQELELAPGLPLRARALRFTSNPEEPLLATTSSRLHVIQPEDGSTQVFLLNRFRATIIIRGLAVDGREAWIGGSDNALIHRRSTNDFQQIQLDLPPRVGACADALTVQPGLTTDRDIADVALIDRDPVLAYQNCTTLFRVRREDGCVSTIALEGEREHSPAAILRVRVHGDQIITSDEAGRLAISARDGG